MEKYNILVTDDLAYAEKQLRENFLQNRDDEVAMYKRVLQDKAAEEELKRLRMREQDEITDDEFYLSSKSTDSSTETAESEPQSNFVFPSDEISDPPTAADFDIGRADRRQPAARFPATTVPSGRAGDRGRCQQDPDIPSMTRCIGWHPPSASAAPPDCCPPGIPPPGR